MFNNFQLKTKMMLICTCYKTLKNLQPILCKGFFLYIFILGEFFLFLGIYLEVLRKLVYKTWAKIYTQAKNLCSISSGSTLFPNPKSIFRERNTIFFENYNL